MKMLASKIYQKIVHLYRRNQHLVTIQNVGVAIGLLIALSWVWGASTTLQKNYTYQRQVDLNAQQIEVMKLQNENAAYQQEYYKSDEFLELSARERLGLASPGEKMVILPSSANIKDTEVVVQKSVDTQSNFSRWMQFFFGNNSPSS